MSEFEQLIETLLQQCVELRQLHPGMAFSVWVPKFGEAGIMFRKEPDGTDNDLRRRILMGSIGVRVGGSVDECIKAIDEFIDREMKVQ
jgi:hypothetical protein